MEFCDFVVDFKEGHFDYQKLESVSRNPLTGLPEENDFDFLI